MTLYINGRSAVHKKSRGILNTTSLNYTPPFAIPMTFPSIAYSKDVQNVTDSVFVNQAGLAHLESYFFPSHGDEGGSWGGMFSGTINAKANFITASPDVLINDKPAVRANDMMVSNNYNSPAAPLQQADLAVSGTGHKNALNDQTKTAESGIVRWKLNVEHIPPLRLTIKYDE